MAAEDDMMRGLASAAERKPDDAAVDTTSSADTSGTSAADKKLGDTVEPAELSDEALARVMAANIEYYARVQRGERPAPEPQEPQEKEEAIRAVIERYKLNKQEAVELRLNIANPEAFIPKPSTDDNEEGAGGGRGRGREGTPGSSKERVKATEDILKTNKFKRTPVSGTVAGEVIRRGYWTSPDDEKAYVILGSGEVVTFDINQAHDFNYSQTRRDESKAMWRTWKGKDAGFTESTEEEIKNAPQDWERFPIETLAALEFTQDQLREKREELHDELSTIGDIIREADIPQTDEIRNLWPQITDQRKAIDAALTSGSFLRLKEELKLLRELVQRKVAGDGGADAATAEEGEKTKDTPEGTPVDVLSRKFMMDDKDRYTHVQERGEWKEISGPGQKFGATDKDGKRGVLILSADRKSLNFTPDDKADDKPKPDDTPDDKKGGDTKYEETPPEAWESLAPKKHAYEEAWEKYGAEERKRNPIHETPPEAWEQYASVHNVRDGSTRVEPDRAVLDRPTRNPWQWFKEVVLGISPPLPEGHKTHAENVLDEMLYGEGHSKEARELAQAAVAQARKVDREAAERGLGKRWGIFDSKLLKAISRHAAIGLTVVGGLTALGLATVTAPVVLGVLGGAIAGQTTKRFLESRGEKGWKTALATWIVGSGTGILTGAIASNVDWGALFGSGTPTGTPIPTGLSDTPGPLSSESSGNAPNNVGPVPIGFFGAEFGELGGQLEITAGPESVWDGITSGLIDHNLLDHRGQQSFAQAFHRTVDGGFRDLFLSLDGESIGKTPWNNLQEGTVADFEKVFSNRNFVEKFCATIEKNYPSLADKIDASGLTVKQFIRGYAYLHGVRIP